LIIASLVYGTMQRSSIVIPGLTRDLVEVAALFRKEHSDEVAPVPRSGAVTNHPHFSLPSSVDGMVEESGDSGARDPGARDSGARDPLETLINVGISFLQQLGNNTKQKASPGLNSFIEKDAQTGKTHLKIPIENKESVVGVIRAFADLLESK